ncbi:MAG TPA: zf-HC2 domain-containing protein [Acidobacteriota bacterium]|nr:zf-HC2 domain-containing protein [Acidobacteriota bacterium]
MEPGLKPDCRVVLAKLYEYLDNELAPAEREKIAAHLEQCRPCLSRFELEGLFQEYVIARAPRPQARAEFKERVLARLAEERAADEAPQSNPRSLWMGWQRFALAAVVVLAVGAVTWWMSDRYEVHAADWPLLSAYHHHMVEVDEDGIETTDFAEARAFVVSRFGEDVDRTLPLTIPDGIATCSACIEPLEETRIAHLAFASDQGAVSLFMLPVSSFTLTDETPVELGGQIYHTVTIGCCRGVCWHKGGGFVCALVSDCEIPRLLALAEACHSSARQTREYPVVGAARDWALATPIGL